MKAQLLAWYAGLERREQQFVSVGGTIGALILILSVLFGLQSRVHAARKLVEQQREDLHWIESRTAQLAALGPEQSADTHESLVVLVDRSVRGAGLAQNLTASQPSGDGGLQVRFQGAPFDALVGWLGQLNLDHQVLVQSASIESARGAGLVNATLVLRGH